MRDAETSAPRLETAALTVVFWASAFLFAIAFWVTPFPPLIDYPQHVAVGALLRRMLDPASPERGVYDVNLITYNGGFHVLVALISLVVRPETAGKILLSLYSLSFAFAALALVRVAGRPRWYALLVLPITFSFAVGWGFANFFISVPLVVLTYTWWLHGLRGERGMLWRVMLASAVLSYTHVLATLCLCVLLGVSGLLMFSTLGTTWRARTLRLVRIPLWVWPAIVWSLFVFVRNRYSPHANWEGWDDGLDDPLWYKLLHLTAYAVGNFSDRSDQILLALSVAILILIYKWESRAGSSDPLMRGLAILWGALYCVIPKVFIATWFIFERFPPFILLFGAAATPVVEGRGVRWLRRAAATCALLAGASTVWHMIRIPGAADADAVIDSIPPDARVIAVTWSNTGEPVILREMWVHVLAYYQARRPGKIAYSFAKFESMPVHYRSEGRPPAIPGGMEWDARKYDPTKPWARYWDTVLVRTPDARPDADPRQRTFGAMAPCVQVLAQRGRFWLFSTSAPKCAVSPSEDEDDQ
jgi:hypothetical protein